MTKCEKCGQAGTDVGWDRMTDWDKAVVVSGSRGAHPLHLAFLGLSTLAKFACSTVFHCAGCKRNWRVWFK
jgi:hypothetical protein